MSGYSRERARRARRSVRGAALRASVGPYISRFLRGCIVMWATACASIHGRQTPVADHHQHFFSPTLLAWAQQFNPAARRLKPVTAAELIAYLDSAGIQRAVVLSTAYQYGRPSLVVENEYERVKAENDWTSQQVALYPDRLVAFCGLNPIKPYALEEIARCGRDPRLRRGLKLHFGNSDIDVHDPAQLVQLQRVFRAANAQGMAIVAHVRSSVDKNRPHGAAEARIILDSLLPLAKDVPVQIAHLAGAGRYDAATDSAMAVFASAIAAHDPRMARVYVDVSGIWGLAALPAEQRELIAVRIRQIGVERIVYGSDGVLPAAGPREYWANLRSLPLTEAEFRAIASNVAPYAK